MRARAPQISVSICIRPDTSTCSVQILHAVAFSLCFVNHCPPMFAELCKVSHVSSLPLQNPLVRVSWRALESPERTACNTLQTKLRNTTQGPSLRRMTCIPQFRLSDVRCRCDVVSCPIYCMRATKRISKWIEIDTHRHTLENDNFRHSK